MDYKTINKFIDVLEDLVNATKAQTSEIKKFRTDLKLNNITPHVKEESKVKKFKDPTPVGSTKETVKEYKGDGFDGAPAVVDGGKPTGELTEGQPEVTDKSEHLPVTGKSGDLKINTNEGSDKVIGED